MPSPGHVSLVVGDSLQCRPWNRRASHRRTSAASHATQGNLAKALRGSKAKPVIVDRLPQRGTLAAHSEEDIIATIEQLVRERKLVRRGRKYPTVALPSARAA